MSKNFFQRLIAILIILMAWLIDVPSIFKDIAFIVLAIALFVSTLEIFKNKKNSQ
jgi:hypothetical protein